MDPRAVVILGSTNGDGGKVAPFSVDSFGFLQVSSPGLVTYDSGTGLLHGAEVQALMVDILQPFFVFQTSAPPALLTASAGFTQGWGSGDLISMSGVDSTVDGWTGSDIGAASGDGSSVLTLDQLYAWNGAAYDRVRIANVFHTALITASGTHAVWTPTAGTSFRLMGYSINVAGTAAATGVQTIELLDGATVIKNHLATVLQTFAATTALATTVIDTDLGQGQLSAAANNVLNINLSESMATGGVSINVWGTEE
jgi:hypothetical protein